MPTEQATGMARGRALMTETERQNLTGAHGDQRRYEAVARVRARIEDELTQDVELIKENHPDLFEELQAVVCDA